MNWRRFRSLQLYLTLFSTLLLHPTHLLRFLSAVDLNLGGTGNPSKTGLYYAKIGSETPSKDYYVQVDTGSDLLWVNCAGCDKCPTKSTIGIDLTLFDPAKSKSSGEVGCSDEFFISTYAGELPELPGCKSETGKIAGHTFLELEPDHGARYVLMSNIHADVNQWEEARRVRKLMENKGIQKPPGWSYIEFNGALHRFLASEKS